jgi:hypothetical protein
MPQSTELHGNGKVMKVDSHRNGCVCLFDCDGIPVEFDNVSSGNLDCGYFINVAVVQHKINVGVNFSCGDYDSAVDTETPKYWLLKVPATKFMHFTYWVKVNNSGVLELFEDSTVSANGSLLVCRNSNRNSSAISTLLHYKDPTVVADGNRVSVYVLGSSGVAQPSDSGGDMFQDDKIIMKQGVNYLIKFTAGNDNTGISLCVNHYETP